jgi:hypothetical protein
MEQYKREQYHGKRMVAKPFCATPPNTFIGFRFLPIDYDFEMNESSSSLDISAIIQDLDLADNISSSSELPGSWYLSAVFVCDGICIALHFVAIC